MKKVVIALVFALFFTSSTNNTFAQQKTFQLNPVGNYETTANVKITPSQGRYNIEISTNNLPSSIPNNNNYYVAWATIPDGRADNLGTITNGATLNSNLNQAPRQFFITAEKERFPEFVQGPRITQSAQISSSELPDLTSTPQPTSTASPQGHGGGGGTPKDVPETGLGGSVIFYGATSTLVGLGSIGILTTYLKQRKQTTKKK